MRDVKEITIDDTVYEIKELNVGEVRKWMKSEIEFEDKYSGKEGSGGVDLVGEWLMNDIPFRVLLLMTNIQESHLDDMLPGNLNLLVEACKEVNPYFFALRQKLILVGDQVLEKRAVSNN